MQSAPLNFKECLRLFDFMQYQLCIQHTMRIFFRKQSQSVLLKTHHVPINVGVVGIRKMINHEVRSVGVDLLATNMERRD